jgi:hypothetical protein
VVNLIRRPSWGRRTTGHEPVGGTAARVVMTLLVQDEEDVLRDHISFHLDRGVDFVIVTDNNSRDSTPDILDEFRRAGAVRIIHEPGDDYSQSKWVTRMARMAAAEEGADWVVNSDADEFWWPEEGDIKSVLASVPARYGQVKVPRFNFVPLDSEEGSPLDRMVYRRSESKNALGRPVLPKVCHRADPEVVVAQGNHHIVADGRLRPYKGAVPMVIFHFPQRSYAQFENRCVRGGQAYERNTDATANMGAHWRDNYKRFKEGTLKESWERRAHDPSAVQQGVAEGRLVLDRRLADALVKVRASKRSAS